jgi:hypothetical protein
MINVTRAIGLGWVRDCEHCAEGRKLLADLLKFHRTTRHGEAIAFTTGLGGVQIRCAYCNGRGWVLTAEGQQLLDLVQELYPELCSWNADANGESP